MSAEAGDGKAHIIPNISQQFSPNKLTRYRALQNPKTALLAAIICSEDPEGQNTPFIQRQLWNLFIQAQNIPLETVLMFGQHNNIALSKWLINEGKINGWVQEENRMF